MSTTVNKGYATQVTGTNAGTWGDTLNTGVMGIVDTNMAGLSTFSVAGSNITLSLADVQNCIYRFTGSISANIVVSPSLSGSPTPASLFNGFYFWENLTTGNFTITLTTSAGSVVLQQSRRGLVFIDSVNGPRIIAEWPTTANYDMVQIPAGTPMLFYQSAAPTGWTISSSLNDYGLRIVSSSGGVTSGSVAYSTLFGRTATDNYTLQIADIPPHNHTTFAFKYGLSNGGAKVPFLDQTSGDGNGLTSSTGGGGPHSHAIDMRVKTADVIICTKN